ncbi:hypothetical protein BDD12DRAFT_24653 [Trichophaea hybrida]|nr:hypothetical protein BDD12DRAFT_24653 [Trichophaea hybrida]
MTVKGLLTTVFVDLLLPALVILNIYLYFYPVLYSCAFSRLSDDTPAPFRLLTLADPQIEGDTTLRKYERPRRFAEELESLSLVERLLVEARDAHISLKKHAKMLDLWGNDLYLSHVYKTVKRLTYPTHVTVLGDMLGSQWISDEEFQRRSNRYWRIFDDAVPVTAEDVERGTADDETWINKLIMMPGNHDVGYAGDISRPRLRRYENAFGPFNYKLAFHPPANASFTPREPPELRIAVLNSLTLDTPIWDQSLADDSYSFVDSLAKNRSQYPTQATVLLTHLPFHKQHGLCVDGPEIIHFPPDHGGGIRSQNFVTETVSDLLKGQIFGVPGGNEAGYGAKSRGVVMTGHDHEGCQTVHFWDEDGEEARWNVVKHQEWVESGKEKMVGSIREVTVRSMMGEFGGNAGLFSAWFDWENNEWKFDYSSCLLGVQHVWWTVHVVNVIAVIWAVVLAFWYMVVFIFPAKNTGPAKSDQTKADPSETNPANIAPPKIVLPKKRRVPAKKSVSMEKKKQ